MPDYRKLIYYTTKYQINLDLRKERKQIKALKYNWLQPKGKAFTYAMKYFHRLVDMVNR